MVYSNADIVKYFQDQFGFKLPSELIPNRRPTAKLLANLQASDCLKVLRVLKCVLLIVVKFS